MKTEQKMDRLLALIILVGILAFTAIFLGVTYPRPEAPGEAVVLPELPEDIVTLGYESHFTGMFVELFVGAEETTQISCTASCVITPTGTYQPLGSGGNVTCTLETAGAPGRYTGVRNVTYTTGSLLWLVNESDTTIKIQEGSTAKMSGTDTDLGQYDDLLLFFDGIYWVELAQADN